jgi:topoisomerase IV subunit A
VFEPKTSKTAQQELITALLAYTSLESSCSINLTAIGIDGVPKQKSLREMLSEWIEFRATTIERRSRHRLEKVLDRLHILEGRQIVLLNIDEVIAIIRQSDEPKAALMARFKLTDRQAEDILEIRLRQLARLEAIKIEQEMKELRDEKKKLEEIIGSPAALRRLMIKEIESDAKTFGDPVKDPRRTFIQAEKKAVAEIKVVDEPVTVVVSAKGWVRARTGHGHEAASFAFKSGDDLYDTFECRTVDTLLAFGSNGRVYSVPVASLPGARGDGQPVTTLVELESGTQLVHYFAGTASAQMLLSSSGGYGFIASVEHMISRQKAGKAFITVGAGETVCKPSPLEIYIRNQPLAGYEPAQSAIKSIVATHVACASTGGRILTFEITELKAMAGGGRGLMLIDLDAKDALAGAAAYSRSIKILGIGRGGKEREEQLEIRSLNNARAARARKGKAADLGFKPTAVIRVE